MGIDLKAGGRIVNKSKKESRTVNVYLRLLIKLYTFLSRRTEAKFNQVILKRLKQSRIQRYPMSLSKVVKNAGKAGNQILVCVCKVLDDERLLTIPKLTLCCLKIAESARKRILAAGGNVLTFDQLALKAPTGTNTVLLRGTKSREALRHFGKAPGTKGSHTKPYTRTRHSEIARGR